MKKIVVSVALLAFAFSVPVLGMAAENQSLGFAALQNLSASQDALTPMQDTELAAVEGQGYEHQWFRFVFKDPAVVIIQQNVFGNNYVTVTQYN